MFGKIKKTACLLGVIATVSQPCVFAFNGGADQIDSNADITSTTEYTEEFTGIEAEIPQEIIIQEEEPEITEDIVESNDSVVEEADVDYEQEYIDAQEDLDYAEESYTEASQNYEEAVETTAVAQEAYDTAVEEQEKVQADVDTAKEEQVQAEEKISQAQDNVTEAEKAVAEAESKRDDAVAFLDELKDNLDEADAKVSDKEGEYTQAQAEFVKAAEEQKKAEENLTKAQQEVKHIEEAIESSKQSAENAAKLETAQKKLIEAQKAYDEAQEKFALGAVGFYIEDYGEENVKKLLEEDYPLLSAYTNIGSEGDATSFENTLRALELIEEFNNLRALHGLTPMRTHTDQMLTAAITANANKDFAERGVFEHLGPENGVENPSSQRENVSWGYADPFEGWYWKEKGFVDSGYTPPGWSTGHYYNIIAKDGNNVKYQIVGMGHATGGVTGTVDVSQSSPIRNSSKVECPTVEEYIEAFKAYVEKTTTAVDEAKAKLETAQAELDALIKAKPKKAPMKVEDLDAKLVEAKENVEQAQKDLDDAVRDEEAAKEAKDLAFAAYTDAQAEQTEAQKSYDEQAQVVAGLTGVYNDAVKARNEAQRIYNEAVKNAPSSEFVQDLEAKLNSAKEEVARTAKALDEAKVNEAQAKEDLDNAETALFEAQGAFNDAYTAYLKSTMPSFVKDLAEINVEDLKSDDIDSIKAIIEAYDELNDAQKALAGVDASNKIDELTTWVENVKPEVPDVEEPEDTIETPDYSHAYEVLSHLKTFVVEDLTDEHVDAVTDAIARYNDLNEDEKVVLGIEGASHTGRLQSWVDMITAPPVEEVIPPTIEEEVPPVVEEELPKDDITDDETKSPVVEETPVLTPDAVGELEEIKTPVVEDVKDIDVDKVAAVTPADENSDAVVEEEMVYPEVIPSQEFIEETYGNFFQSMGDPADETIVVEDPQDDVVEETEAPETGLELGTVLPLLGGLGTLGAAVTVYEHRRRKH